MDTHSEFVPRFTLELGKARAKDFEALTEEFEIWRKKEPAPGAVPFSNGWQTITPEIAEQLLKRSPLGKNRKPAFATIVYYADQMKRDDWPQTGQPLIFCEDVLIDGQHRIWASYLSGASFTTYVVTDVPRKEHLFAYIDNVKTRTPAAALQTAGLNGISATIVAVLKIAEEYEIGAYTAAQVLRQPRLSPIQYLEFAAAHPNVRRATHLAASDYAEASKVIGHKDVVGFLTMKILDHYDQLTADMFFEEMGDLGHEFDPDSPIEAMHKLLAADLKSQKPMKRHQVLGNLIKCFNFWKQGQPVKPRSRWFMGAHEDFPRFLESGTEQNGNGDPDLVEEETDEFASSGPASDGLEYAATMRKVQAEVEAHPSS